MAEVELDEGITRIGNNVYSNNTALRYALLPKSLEEIGTNNFRIIDKTQAVFYGYKDSYGETYSGTLPVKFIPLYYPLLNEDNPDTVYRGRSYKLSARIYTGIGIFNEDILWSVSGNISSGTKISQNGILNIGTDETADEITVTAGHGENTESFVLQVKNTDVQVYGTSLALEGEIGINFYLDIMDDQVNDLEIVMVMGDQETVIPASEGIVSTVSGRRLRMFAYPVAAKEMSDQVVISVRDKEGNPVSLTKENIEYPEGYGYRATDYFARAEEAGKEKTKKLVRVLNNFGKYAQIYFGYNVTDDVLDTDDVSHVSAETLEPYKAIISADEVEGISYVGGSTMLDGAIGYRLYFKVEEGHRIADYTFTMDGNKVTPVKSGSQYYIEKADIAAKDLGVMNQITVSDGTATKTIRYSALSYAYTALTLTGDNRVKLQNMCRAMYLYNQQAIEYFNS